jgi:hypothetical protein
MQGSQRERADTQRVVCVLCRAVSFDHPPAAVEVPVAARFALGAVSVGLIADGQNPGGIRRG